MPEPIVTPPPPAPPASPEGPARRRRHPRARRLVRAADFARVYRDGNRARGALITVAVAGNDLGRTRLGLSIGKRVHRRAVRRNRLRRLFREAFRLEHDALPAGVDLVVIGSVPGIDPTLEEVRRELVRLARKAHRRWREKTATPGDGAA
jgi:ribonuclease P protein component